MPGYWVFCYSNNIYDLFDEKRWGPKKRVKTLHEVLRQYIKKYLRPDGTVARTKGKKDSKTLAVKIFKRMMQMVKEDMTEEYDFFHLPNKSEVGLRMVYDFNPNTLNRKFESYIKLAPGVRQKIGNDYIFIFDVEGYLKLKRKILVNHDSSSFGPYYNINASSNPQEYYNRQYRYRKLVWGMHRGSGGIYGNGAVPGREVHD